MIELSQETKTLAQRIALAKHVAVDEAIRSALEETARKEGIAFVPRWTRDPTAAAAIARRARMD